MKKLIPIISLCFFFQSCSETIESTETDASQPSSTEMIDADNSIQSDEEPVTIPELTKMELAAIDFCSYEESKDEVTEVRRNVNSDNEMSIEEKAEAITDVRNKQDVLKKKVLEWQDKRKFWSNEEIKIYEELLMECEVWREKVTINSNSGNLGMPPQ